jgi:hypothetical protein
MSKEKEIVISLINHSWLDTSESWFLRINDSRHDGEFTTEDKARDAGIALAEIIGAEFRDEIEYTSELFS